jgi:succinate dehydrogenase / fumarate reductase flavoprotein subunit
MIYHKVVVVGGGLAGLRAAIEAAKNNLDVAVITKVHPIRSHSVAAQGGINAALGNAYKGVVDTPAKHAFDTIKGSDFLADQDAVKVMCDEGPDRIYEMEHWGCAFDRTPEGTIGQRPFGGAGFPRTCYVADKTGHALLHTLYEQSVKYGVKIYEEWMVLDLVVEGGECRGVVALDCITGRLEPVMAEAVIFGTGGAGRMYGNTTNALISTGLAMAIPYFAGVPVKDLEFIQFHPTTLWGTNILMTEGCRGEGGYLKNKAGDRFMLKYAPDFKELAPRDIVSRCITTEVLEGRGFENAYVHLDLRHLGEEKISTGLPGIRELCINFAGVDPVKDPIPVQPGQHYTMGGIDCDADGATEVKGFYAAGECACVSVHGANRLGGNSLLDTIVFGARSGAAVAGFIGSKAESRKGEKAIEAALGKREEKLAKITSAGGKENVARIKDELGTVMKDKAGVYRAGAEMKEGLQKVRELKERFMNAGVSSVSKRLNFELIWYLEMEGNLEMAHAVLEGGLAREESRGSHSRSDFPKRDDEKWLKHTLARYTPDGPKLAYKPVTLGIHKPVERRY